jgi:hypothetical protein
MKARYVALLDIVEEQKPMTVREVFYQATVRGIVEKTEAGYAKVQRTLAERRRGGLLPWHWIADNTRWQRKPITYNSLAHALDSCAAYTGARCGSTRRTTSRSGWRRTRSPA